MKISTKRLRIVLLSFLFTSLLSVLLFLLYRNHEKSALAEKPVNHHDKEKDKAATDFAGAAEYEFELVKNPETGTIPEGIRDEELAQAKEIEAYTSLLNAPLVNSYSFQGPNNLGGRTRAMAYDVRYNGGSNQTILAGGVSGGIYKSIDNGTTWIRKSPLGQHFSATSLAQDTRTGGAPAFRDTWYYTTGEASGNSAGPIGVPGSSSTAFYSGNGVYKSTDNGETWTRLASSNTTPLEQFNVGEDIISKVIVNPVNGDIYIACAAAIRRSQDGGATWATVLSGALANTGQFTDVVVTSAGRLYAAFGGSNANTVDGVWTSTTGNSGDWTRIAGTGAATNPATWNAQGAYGRVVLGIAPSDEDKVYALYYNNINSACAGTPVPEAELFRWSLAGISWTDLSANLPDETGCSNGNDPFAVQGGYDLVVAVKPDDANTVFLGGTNIYRSTDGFTSTTNTTRIGGYAGTGGYAQYTNSHPDIHSIVFQPGSPSVMLCGNDGGIQRTTDVLAATVAWTPINTGYRTYQYYYVTLDPRNNNTKVLGGAQDNGTTRNIGGSGSNFEVAFGGDGVSVGLGNVIGPNTFEYVGFQSGDIYRRNSTSVLFAGTFIRPTAATDNGIFVTLFRLDPDNTETLYYASDSSLYRNTSASTATTGNWTALTGVPTTIVDGLSPKTRITSLATTRGTYNAATASLFIGTNERRIYRLDDPANVAAATAPVNISSASFPAGGLISSIAVNPRNDDTVLITFSNYGVTSVWWTGNANSATPTWQNVEGNLTLPSFRSSAIAITNVGVEYFVGTSVGLYTATINELSPGTTAWTQEGASEIGNAVVSSLALRPIDNRLLVGTHGYGMWATTLPTAALPVTFTRFSVTAETRHNSLAWQTQDEQNNKGFELERRYPNQLDFEKIAFVTGANKDGANKYQFNDYTIDLGIADVFYRLKQIDLDGKYNYSTTVRVQRKGSAKFIEYISTNGNSLLLRVNNAVGNRNISIRLLDVKGRLVKQLELSYITQQIDISKLAAGAYIIEITDRQKNRFTDRFIKQ
jgi:hypothetical protein